MRARTVYCVCWMKRLNACRRRKDLHANTRTIHVCMKQWRGLIWSSPHDPWTYPSRPPSLDGYGWDQADNVSGLYFTLTAEEREAWLASRRVQDRARRAAKSGETEQARLHTAPKLPGKTNCCRVQWGERGPPATGTQESRAENYWRVQRGERPANNFLFPLLRHWQIAL